MPPDGFHLRLNALSTCGPQIAHGRGQISVTQPLLHGLKVDTRLETPGREGGYELAKLILGWVQASAFCRRLPVAHHGAQVNGPPSRRRR